MAVAVYYLFTHQAESMQSKLLRVVTVSLFIAALAACGGGGESATPLGTSTPLTVTGTTATGLAIAGATVTGKCKVGSGTATTLANGTFTLTVTDGQLPCILQITNPADGIKLHTLVSGTGSTAVANITPLTEMTTARVLGREPNMFFAAFDAAVATQKVTTANIASAQTDIGLVFAGIIDTTGIVNFITTPLVAATQGSPTSGDAQDKLLDALKLKLTTAQLGTVTTALASNQTADAVKQIVISLTTATTTPPVANVGAAQSVVAGSTVTLDASTSSAATGKSLTYAWTLTSKPAGSVAALAASTTAKPTFVADVAGSYVASVVVNDGTTASSAAAVTVTASVANAAPVANAGVAQNVVAGSVVTLNGSASSDANGDPLTYAWTLTAKPAGSAATLSSATSAKPTFTPDMVGTYVASLTVNDGKINSAVVTVAITVISVGTQVSGIINTNTLWTLANSPYKVTGNQGVQVAYGTTLTIEPGVKITGGSISVFGKLTAIGSASSKITFDKVRISQSGTSSANPSAIEIQYAQLTDGELIPANGNASYGKLILRDSLIENQGYLYLWYPVSTCYIERNIFKNTGGLSVGVSSVPVYITNNVFAGSTNGYSIQNWASYGGENILVSKNSFLDVGKVAVMLPGGYSSSAITAINNYWGTTSQSVIQSMIYDKTNDLSSAGYISFLPFLNQPDALTPIYR